MGGTYQNDTKIDENSVRSAYWRSAQDPWCDVFEAGGTTCKKVILGYFCERLHTRFIHPEWKNSAATFVLN